MFTPVKIYALLTTDASPNVLQQQQPPYISSNPKDKVDLFSLTNPTIQLRAGGAGFPANIHIVGISREYNATHTIQGDMIKVFK